MAGAGYKLFNTGDVLTAAQVNTYLQEQVVMVFNDATARTTALSGVLAEGMVSYLKSTDAVEAYNGSAWVSVAGASSPLTTKGDLYTYSTTNARLAVGNNGETLVADSSATTGLSWTGSMAGGKNAVINGGFDFWQRGTSFNPGSAAYVYTADRWEVYTYAASTCTVSQQTFTAGAAPVAGVEGRFFLNIINTNTGIYLRTKIEDVRTYAGQTVTLSFYAKASSNLTLTSNLEQNFGTGGSAAVANTATHSITTSWQRFTRTVTLASISGKTISSTDSSLQILFTGTNNITLSIWGVQLEYGSVATQFTRAGGTLAGELAACQRYYFRNNSGNTNYSFFGWGIGQNPNVLFAINCPVTMRTTPTTVDFNNLGFARTGAITNVSSLVHSNSSPSVAFLQSDGASTTDVIYRLIANNSSSAYVGIGAEL